LGDRGDRIRIVISHTWVLPQKERQEIRCLKGHMPFGLHSYLPRPAIYITLFRYPVDRMISQYTHVLRTSDHYLHNEVTSKNMSLCDFVSSGISLELTNHQTRLISGIENEPMSAAILEIAKRNLQDRFVAFGLSERFDESLILFKRLLGWRNIFYVRQNVTRSRPSQHEIPIETIRIIEKYNTFDLELYDFAEQKFEDQICEQRASFESELRTFQRLNRVYAIAWRMPQYGIYKVRSLVRKLLLQQDDLFFAAPGLLKSVTGVRQP